MPPDEKRKSLRRPLRYPVCINIGDDSNPTPCTLIDASEGGAQIVVDRADDMPEEFILVFGYDGGVRRYCRVKWRAERRLGVEFIKPPAASNRPRPPAPAEQEPSADAQPEHSADSDSAVSR